MNVLREQSWIHGQTPSATHRDNAYIRGEFAITFYPAVVNQTIAKIVYEYVCQLRRAQSVNTLKKCNHAFSMCIRSSDKSAKRIGRANSEESRSKIFSRARELLCRFQIVSVDPAIELIGKTAVPEIQIRKRDSRSKNEVFTYSRHRTPFCASGT